MFSDDYLSVTLYLVRLRKKVPKHILNLTLSSAGDTLQIPVVSSYVIPRGCFN